MFEQNEMLSPFGTIPLSPGSRCMWLELTRNDSGACLNQHRATNDFYWIDYIMCVSRPKNLGFSDAVENDIDDDEEREEWKVKCRSCIHAGRRSQMRIFHIIRQKNHLNSPRTKHLFCFIPKENNKRIESPRARTFSRKSFEQILREIPSGFVCSCVRYMQAGIT